MRSVAVLAAMVTACAGEGNDPASSLQSLCDQVSTDDLVIKTDSDAEGAAEVERVDGDLLICNSTGIATLSLPQLTEVAGNIILFDNQVLETVELPLLEASGAEPSPRRTWTGLLVERNNALTRVDAPSLRDVREHIWIAGNAALTSFDLPALTRVQGALAFKNTALTAVDGFAELRFIGDALAVYDNAELTEVTGLANVVSVSAELILTNNEKLATVRLPALRTVGGTMEVAEAAALTELDLSALTVVGGGLSLIGSGQVDTSGLAALDTVAGDLAITFNSDLTDITLPALGQVGGELLIADNPAVTAVTCDLLDYVGDSLRLADNDVLASISFAGLAEIAGNLIVTNNAVLPTCAAEGLRDDVGTDQIGGAVSIAGNDDGGTCP